MTSNFVKILIKAPNQLVDDQTVHCERNWTVKRLKHHLANVYPCKPHPDGQKLIYSGQLLSDEALLSEVLRSYDGHENNTIHLVCSMRDTHRMNRHASKPVQTDYTTTPGENSDNLRQPDMNPRPPRQMVFPTISNNPHNMMQQSMIFQQAYFSYMAHFYMMANRMGTAENSNYAYTPVNNTDTPVINDDHREIPPINRNIRNENEVEEGQDEAPFNRNWMEWFYVGSRFFILFTFVYFYSSPERFIMVIAMALIMINIDVFRWRRVHHHHPVNPVPPQNQPLAEETPDIRPPNPENVVEQMSWIHIAWSFMKTFFLSLVPDNRDT